MKEMNNFVVQGHALVLSMTQTNKNFNEKANIIVKNIDRSVTQQ